MAMLIRMSRTARISADGFTVVTVKKGSVYQLPNALGEALVDEKSAVSVDANALRQALPGAHILAGRVTPTDA